MSLRYQILILSVILLISPFDASAGSQSTHKTDVQMGGYGSMTVSSADSWETSTGSLGFITGGEFYNSGTAGKSIVTGSGGGEYIQRSSYNASIVNSYDSSTRLDYTAGGVYHESFAMSDNKPNIPEAICDGNVGTSSATSSSQVAGTPSHQAYEVHGTGLGSTGSYGTDAVILDTDVVASFTAEKITGGRFDVYESALAQAGSDVNTTEENYEYLSDTHYSVSANLTGEMYLAGDFIWNDFSRPMGFGDNLSANNTTVYNQTYES